MEKKSTISTVPIKTVYNENIASLSDIIKASISFNSINQLRTDLYLILASSLSLASCTLAGWCCILAFFSLHHSTCLSKALGPKWRSHEGHLSFWLVEDINEVVLLIGFGVEGDKGITVEDPPKKGQS